VAGIAFVLLLLWIGQRRLIYLPDQSSPLSPPQAEEVSFLTDDGLRLRAWLLGDGDRLVMVFPGNAGHRGHRLLLAEELTNHGLAVLLTDYRGYGGNPGSPSENGLLHDARAARRWAEQSGWTHFIYLGESLGGGPAVALASEQPPAGMVLRSPFPSLVAVGEVHYPFLPVRILLKDRFEVAAHLASPSYPLVVVAGSADSVVPLGLSRSVAEAAGAELVTVDDADHNDPELAWGPQLVEAVVRVASHMPP